MNQFGNFADKWNAAFSQNDEVLEEDPLYTEPEDTTQQRSKVILQRIWKVIYHLRKIVLAVPVLLGALRLAFYNLEHLPEQVGLNLQTNGEFAKMIARETAVYGPLAVTGVCLLLMFLSRKSMYPWIISLFSLVLPVLLLLTNLYPA
jgi:hypothetical protein